MGMALSKVCVKVGEHTVPRQAVRSLFNSPNYGCAFLSVRRCAVWWMSDRSSPGPGQHLEELSGLSEVEQGELWDRGGEVPAPRACGWKQGPGGDEG